MIPINFLFLTVHLMSTFSQAETICYTLARSILFLPAMIHVSHSRDAVADELSEFKALNHSAGMLVTGNGVPIDDKNNILTVGPRGPALLQDFVYLDEMAHFNRERIPARVVHAKGAGAFGYFEVTNDVTQYTKLNALAFVGKRTRVAVRFSAGSHGSADTVRGLFGFCIKFYTEEGIWDLLSENLQVGSFRDAFLVPSQIHSARNPVTNLPDSDAIWDFRSLRRESVYFSLLTYSSLGIPVGYTHMPGYPLHAFKLVNDRGEAVYAKFQVTPDQGEKHLTSEEATVLAGKDPDYSTRDLYNAIKNQNYPSWTLSMQVMTFEQAESVKFNPFDITKIWPKSEFPLIVIGQLVLNEFPSNHFNDVEQIAFSPAHMPPGIEPSPDKVLQGRLFTYSDAQRYRLGVNYLQLPVNCPLGRVANYQRDGASNIRKYDGGPNYYPNSFNGPLDDLRYRQSVFTLSGDVARFDNLDDNNFSQPREYWLNISEEEQEVIVGNLAKSLCPVTDFIQKRALDNFGQVHEDLARRLSQRIQAIEC